MAHNNNLRIIPLTDYAESEEDGELEKDTSDNDESPRNQDDQDSESSRKEGESLDIKPPQVALKFKSRNSRKEDMEKSRHRKHYSNRREHYYSQSRRAHRDQTATWVKESSRTKNRAKDGHSVRYRDDPVYEKERDTQEEDIRIVIDVRNVRPRKDLHETRRRGDNKVKDERESLDDNLKIKEKMKEWRQKRSIFMEKKRELYQNQVEKSWSRKESASGRNDLREKIREKDRMQMERRLERFRSPTKETTNIVSVVEKKELHIISEQLVDEDPMDYEDEESDAKSEEKDDSETDSGSDTASESEASSQNSEDDSEEEEESSSSGTTSEEEEEVGETKPNAKLVHTAVSDPTPVKVELNQEKRIKLPIYLPAIQGCRSVEEFSDLKRIEEGTYGVVYRAKDKRTNEIVALKRLKMEREKEGFPITSLREINTLLKAQHPNIVLVREIVVGSNMDRIYLSMEFVEHDLKSFMEKMKQPFQVGEVKHLMIQLLSAVAHLHDNWILHRDLKTSNLLLSNKGILKVGDFGLAREYGSPLKPYTPVVVTLWYRAPELLLGTKKYSTSIDMWSVGCIFGELLTMKALFPEKCELDQIKRIFKDLGTPSEKIWPGYSELPIVKKVVIPKYPPSNNFRSRFGKNFTDLGFDLVNRLLTYNPIKRISAEDALSHSFFEENPKPISPSMFPNSFTQNEQLHHYQHSPKPPSGGKQYADQIEEAGDEGLMAAAGFHMAGAITNHSLKGGGFTLKF